ncbi:metal ABC transporter solute-binding protein, Zn/Mn family [Halosolutus gelatinilyticus]|uniref:metal ABC transporter solute-binding protein, Zn/Mn family n=1 Tax=Halosolutus gelatinilyticus TaxID=2931975 RepID=UPI001FF50598|nr:zinc ABC transporter substrate-binding protein [Halosolutus gelatinilyticus]
MKLTRRSVLQGSAGALAAGSLAGCLDDVASGADGVETGYAAFFSLWDWTREVAGDEADFENPVPIGEMGHGWEPEGDLVRDIASNDAFVYLDTPEFSWAQDAAETLEADYDTVAVIDVLAGLEGELLAWNHDGAGERDEHGEGGHGDHNHEHDEGGEHDHGNIDPHVWVDPVLAQDLVTNIADGLADADSDAADAFADNAATYNDRLAGIDEEFSTLIDDADRDVGVLAGHNSYQYLQVRYGFELHSPIGVSPQDEPSHDEISGTIELIEQEGIDTILYDRFAAPGEGDLPPLAATLVEDSAATDAVPVTPIEGTLRKWADQGWGYVEQMQEINLPAFRDALGAQ